MHGNAVARNAATSCTPTMSAIRTNSENIYSLRVLPSMTQTGPPPGDAERVGISRERLPTGREIFRGHGRMPEHQEVAPHAQYVPRPALLRRDKRHLGIHRLQQIMRPRRRSPASRDPMVRIRLAPAASRATNCSRSWSSMVKPSGVKPCWRPSWVGTHFSISTGLTARNNGSGRGHGLDCVE